MRKQCNTPDKNTFFDLLYCKIAPDKIAVINSLLDDYQAGRLPERYPLKVGLKLISSCLPVKYWSFGKSLKLPNHEVLPKDHYPHIDVPGHLSPSRSGAGRAMRTGTMGEYPYPKFHGR